eukprot:11479232-Prorocentrum_lima.AAC.1
MTSSLVGSEMCIRDRSWSFFTAGALDDEVEFKQSQAVPDLVQDLASAVSYTHLTLPTICSV